MDVDGVAKYWIELADEDWPVAEHLLASGDYHYALFFGYLYLEKLLKALVVKATGEHAPRTHNLMFLAERAGLDLPPEMEDIFLRATGYSIDARYPGEGSSARRRYTATHAQSELNALKEAGQWLKSRLK
jgi:HEPN domain-containing protein